MTRGTTFAAISAMTLSVIAGSANGPIAASIAAAVKGLLQAGCKPDVSVVATHALFVGPAIARLQALPIRQVIGTNSVALGTDLPASFQVVNLAPMITDTIARLYRDESLEHLLAHG